MGRFIVVDGCLDLDGWNVIGQGDEAWLADFVAAEGEVEEVGIAEKDDDEAWLVAELVGEQALDLGDNGTTDDHCDENA